ncbi:MAG: hypothetical protein Q4C75_07610, partial [Bergeyella zoohelcum]|nr:hypothetical protein [Bergeyella zoohelcum]
MKKILFLLSFIFIIKTNAQTLFSGQVFMRENSAIYLNQVFVTNLNEHKTTISNYNGEFKIPVKIGDVVRFTSIISERYDVKITEQHLKNTLNLIELSPIYYDIKEVVINWKPSGNLRKDVLSLKDTDKKIALAKTIGLPQGKSRDEVTEAPIVGAKNGSLSLDIQSIYDVISGERKKKQRLYQYE